MCTPLPSRTYGCGKGVGDYFVTGLRKANSSSCTPLSTRLVICVQLLGVVARHCSQFHLPLRTDPFFLFFFPAPESLLLPFFPLSWTCSVHTFFHALFRRGTLRIIVRPSDPFYLPVIVSKVTAPKVRGFFLSSLQFRALLVTPLVTSHSVLPPLFSAVM